MWFLIAGLVLGALYLGDVSPVAGWHWGWILLPFGLAALWWAVADATGFTQRRAIDKMELKKETRRQRDMEALGLNVRRERRVKVIRDAADRAKEQAARAGSDEEERREPRM
ncbi:MAG: TIGR04438 family Trp-rich protein [Rubrivivax sp.]